MACLPLLPPCSGLDVLPKFAGFLKASPEEAATKEAELVACLRALNDHLGAWGRVLHVMLHDGAAAPGCASGHSAVQREVFSAAAGPAAAADPCMPAALHPALPAAHGPFIGGAAPCATDCAVMPRLYHMKVGGAGWGGVGWGEVGSSGPVSLWAAAGLPGLCRRLRPIPHLPCRPHPPPAGGHQALLRLGDAD